MPNSMVASNYKVSNYIPDDIEFSILSKLPLKSLKRFRSVCKSWSLLFENPNFMSMYRINFLSKNHACYNDTSVLLHQEIDDYSFYDKCELYSLSGDRFETRIKLDWPNPFQEDHVKGINILGSYSINGILFLRHIFRYALIFWNPATKEFKVIPCSPSESIPQLEGIVFDSFLFGYDRVREDYKVIQYVQIWQSSNRDLDGLPMGDPSYDSWWEIYSLSSNSWKKLDSDSPRASDYVFMDGVGHWWSKPITHNEASLESFDFSNEIFFTTPIPSDIMGEIFDFSLVWRGLVVLNGSIALMINYRETNTFHISILGEVGVKDSWTKLFVFGLLPCIEYPLGAWKNGVMFLGKEDWELVWFDLSTHKIEEFGLLRHYDNKMVIYKESLLPIGGVSD